MAIETIDNFGVFVGKNIDSRYGPYVDTTEANLAIDSIFRFKGLTVLITGSGDIVEYWYYAGITDPDLVPKTATAAGAGLSVAATASFTNATTWNFTHNLQSRYVVIQALDLNHQQIIPETITLVNTSSATLTFPTPESGYAIATIGGTTASLALTASSIVTSNGSTIYGSGTNLIIDPANNLIISGNMIPGPPYTDNTSSYDLGSPTAAWNHLYVANGSIIFITGSDSASISYINNNLAFSKHISGSFTGSLFGTASWASSASQALTSSYVTGSIFTNTNPALSASMAATSSVIDLDVLLPGTAYIVGTSATGTGAKRLINNIFSYNTSTKTLTNVSASYALTSSYLTTLNQNLIISGNIIPAGPYTNNTSSYDLGSSTAAWRDLYVSNGSIKMISGSNSASIQFNNGTVTFAGASVTLPSSSTVPTASYVTPYEGAWTSYTPIWTAASVNPSINNGTVQGWYKLVGKTCFVRGNIVMGSTTTFGSGEWYVSMPFTASHADAILMTANLLDNGTAWYNATVNGARAGFNYKAPIQYQGGAGTALDVNATQPYTWASTDRFLWNGSYEIA
jgi:hypothetical protein